MENTTIKTNSLSIRWNAFVQAEEGEHDKWVWIPECLQRFNGVQGNVIEKVLHERTEPNQTVKTIDMVKMLQNQIGLSFSVVEVNGKGEKNNKVEVVTSSDVVNLKEEILKEKIWSYKYAW